MGGTWNRPADLEKTEGTESQKIPCLPVIGERDLKQVTPLRIQVRKCELRMGQKSRLWHLWRPMTGFQRER